MFYLQTSSANYYKDDFLHSPIKTGAYQKRRKLFNYIARAGYEEMSGFGASRNKKGGAHTTSTKLPFTNFVSPLEKGGLRGICI